MEAVQMNTRIDRTLKLRGDEVFARAGFTPSQVVRAVWEYAAEHLSVPPFMDKESGTADETEAKVNLVRQGAGLAYTVATRDCGFAGSRAVLASEDLDAMRDDMYDAMLDEMEARCS